MSEPKRTGFDIGPVICKDQTIRSGLKDILPQHPFRLMLSGASGTGKTTLLLNMLLDKRFKLRDFFSIIFLFCPTAKVDPQFLKLRDIIPEENIFTELSEEKLNEIVSIQSKIVEKIGKKLSPSILIIFEDCITHKVLDTKAFKILFFRGRHMNFSLSISVQYFMGVPKSVRQNMSNIMIFRPMRSERKVIAEELCPGSMELKEFGKMIDFATEPREGDEFPFFNIFKERSVKKMFRRNLTKLISCPEESAGSAGSLVSL